jgi:hypothetical protein
MWSDDMEVRNPQFLPRYYVESCCIVDRILNEIVYYLMEDEDLDVVCQTLNEQAEGVIE